MSNMHRESSITPWFQQLAGFLIHEISGFTMTFENRFSIRVDWSRFATCDNMSKDRNLTYCKTAEVVWWYNNDKTKNCERVDNAVFQTPEDVQSLIAEISRHK